MTRFGDWTFRPRTSYSDERVPMNVAPEVRTRLRNMLLHYPELQAVGYTAFLDRACELAEAAIAEERRS